MENTLENALVHQKDAMYALVNGTLSQIEMALIQMETLFELWCQAQYHYKGGEVCRAICRTLDTLIDATTNWKRLNRLYRIHAQAKDLERRFWEAESAWKAGR
jgi:thiaminase